MQEQIMSLGAGTRLGPYEILGTIGAGGMGEVYRARDTRLDRTVAIKVLPPELSRDGERRERFQREARTLASLSHPRICPLFDVGEHDGSAYLVMGHVEGETLLACLERGPLPVAQAIRTAAEIAEGLDAAHKRGIVHRDLKPGNIMLTKSGAVLLDFGLAKLRGHGERPALVLEAYAPTAVETLTRSGAIMGTLHYMAPEQVQGKEADARADLWALGVILHEMVSGARPFAGDTAASLLGAILERDPPALPAAPPALNRLVRRCLAKHPDERWESARDLADDLRWIATDGGQNGAATAAAKPPLWRRAVSLAAIAGGGVLAGMGLLRLARPAEVPRSADVVRSLIDVSPADEVRSASTPAVDTRTPGGSHTAFAWTADGRTLVFAGRQGETQQLFVRRLDTAEVRPIQGTEGAQVPTVSPDGRRVAFWADGAIKKVSIAGGPPTVLVSGLELQPAGMDWGADDVIVLSHAGVIRRVGVDGQAEALTTLAAGELKHISPHLLPGHSALLFTVRRRSWSWGDEEIVAQELATGKRTVLLHDASDARYLPSGHLLFMRQGTLWGVGFDPRSLRIVGEPLALVGNVAQALTSGTSWWITGAGQFAVSETGDLAYIESPIVPFAETRIVTVDRSGRVSPVAAPVRSYSSAVDLAPSTQRLAVTVFSTMEAGIWTFDLVRHTLSQLSPAGAEALFPRWSPDGRQLAFSSNYSGTSALARQASDASAAPELFGFGGAPSSWSADGRHLVFVRNFDIWSVDLAGSPLEPIPIVRSPSRDGWPALSPDGRWLAFGSNRSGRYEVYLEPFRAAGPILQVSVNGGSSPAWNPNGRELFFSAPHNDMSERRAMMAVDVSLTGTPALGAPRALFEFDRNDLVSFIAGPASCYAVSPDGERFYSIQRVKADPSPPVTHINLVLNWRAELEAKVPSGL